MKIDLHNHTFYSDGKFSPEELVLRAKRNGVDVFALTDHDDVWGVKEALKYCNRKFVYGNTCSSRSSWAMDVNDFKNITNQVLSTDKCFKQKKE